MLKRIAFLLCIIIFTTVSSISAITSSDMDHINEKTDEALQMVKIKRYKDAANMLNAFSAQYLSLTTKEDVFNMDELRIMTAANDEAIKSLNSPNSSYDHKVNAVTKLRLVVDAVNSQHQPLWAEMEERMMATFSDTKKAVVEKNPQMFHSELNDLLIQYDLIYYSLKVDLNVETVQNLDARFQYLDRYRPEVFENTYSQQEIDALQYDMQTIFEEMKEDEADPSLWWVIISTGSIIIGTLSYVGWRKYKGDKEVVKKGKKLKD